MRQERRRGGIEIEPFAEIPEIREMNDQVMLMLASGKMVRLRGGGSVPKIAKLIRNFVQAENNE